MKLSDYQYSVLIYVLAMLVAGVFVFLEPGEWDLLREAKVFGYPRWMGNVLSAVIIVEGSSVGHVIWEWLKKFASFSEPDVDESVG